MVPQSSWELWYGSMTVWARMATMEESYNQPKPQAKKFAQRIRCLFFTHSGRQLPLTLSRVQMVFIQSLILEERQLWLGKTTLVFVNLVWDFTTSVIDFWLLLRLGDDSSPSERWNSPANGREILVTNRTLVTKRKIKLSYVILKRPSHGKLKLANSCSQTQVSLCERHKNSRQTLWETVGNK